VSGLRPIVEESPSIVGPGFQYKGADRVVGFHAQPCGHRIDEVTWSDGRYAYGYERPPTISNPDGTLRDGWLGEIVAYWARRYGEMTPEERAEADRRVREQVDRMDPSGRLRALIEAGPEAAE
jgi:hypothetical protein